MQSSDFRPVTGPLTTAMDRPRRMAKGGHAHAEPAQHGALHHLTIVLPMMAPAAPQPAAAPPQHAPLSPAHQAIVDRWIAYARSSPAAMRDTLSRIERIRRGESVHSVAPGLLPPPHPRRP